MRNLKVNPKCTVQSILIPGTNLYAYIIDDFLVDIASVMHFAQHIAYFNPMFADNSYYPGVRDNMPLPYQRLLQTFFQEQILPNIKDNDYNSVAFHKCLLSLTSCKPSSLLIDQKIPHVDSCKTNDFALVHYLSGKELGGTSLYRYKPKNLIVFEEADEATLKEMIADVTVFPQEHRGYITQSTSIFEQILSIEAKVNRLVIYQGNILHSANLTSERSYSGDAINGRLSIASFCSVQKKLI